MPGISPKHGSSPLDEGRSKCYVAHRGLQDDLQKDHLLRGSAPKKNEKKSSEKKATTCWLADPRKSEPFLRFIFRVSTQPTCNVQMHPTGILWCR